VEAPKLKSPHMGEGACPTLENVENLGKLFAMIRIYLCI